MKGVVKVFGFGGGVSGLVFLEVYCGGEGVMDWSNVIIDEFVDVLKEVEWL